MATKRLKTTPKLRSRSGKRPSDAPRAPIDSGASTTPTPPVPTPAAPSSPVATLDYVSPPLVPKMARRLKTSPERIPTSSLRIRAPPLVLNSVEDLFGSDDDDLTPRTQSPAPSSPAHTESTTSSFAVPSTDPIHPSFSPGPYPNSPSSTASSARELALEEELYRMQDFNHRLQDDVIRLGNLMATTTIEIRICGSPTKRGLPCKNRRGTCPFHSPSGTPKAGCQHFAPHSFPSPAYTNPSEEQWQL
jgi:hypothetical protein